MGTGPFDSFILFAKLINYKRISKYLQIYLGNSKGNLIYMMDDRYPSLRHPIPKYHTYDA